MIYTMKKTATSLKKTALASAMKRTNMYFTELQFDALTNLSEKTGLSVAEHVRRAVDRYLKTQAPKA